MKYRYAVMGNPIDHSLSPMIHQLFAKQTGHTLEYEKILIKMPCFEQQVADFFSQGGRGLNITLPGKERAFAMADQVTRRCFEAKAANTLWRDARGLQGDNTDGIGLLRDLVHYIDLSGKHVLVLGAGGAARGILGPLLAESPACLMLVNRTRDKARALCRDFSSVSSCDLADLDKEFDLVINATSSGLSDQVLELPAKIIKPTTLCYDLAYNIHQPTSFVAWAQKQGCIAMDGLGMLVEQAAEAFTIWHGVMPQVGPIIAGLRK